MPRIEKGEIFDYVVEYAIKSGLDGSYLEFGVWTGDSFILAYRAYRKWLAWAEEVRAGAFVGMIPPRGPKAKAEPLYAFDSFQGLPPLREADRLAGYDYVEEALYQCALDAFLGKLSDAEVELSSVRAIPGFFEQSLRSQNPLLAELNKAMIVHVDCDLYSSAVQVFEFITPILVDGAVVLLDDFGLYRYRPDCGVQRAFSEWLKRSGFRASHYTNYSWAAAAFIVHK